MEKDKQDEERKQANYNQLLQSMRIGEELGKSLDSVIETLQNMRTKLAMLEGKYCQYHDEIKTDSCTDGEFLCETCLMQLNEEHEDISYNGDY